MDEGQHTRELAVVMPVYNEQDCIAAVVRSWHDTLARLKVDFLMIVINDGSRDDTGAVLQALALDRLCILHQANYGHGPTILRGYEQACRTATWVFQCDSDNEMPPAAFGTLWQVREQYEAVFGYRQARRQSSGRRFISLCSRATVRLVFGKGVRDVNTPYRLIRAEVLRPIVARIPPDTFAPNVIISGALARAGRRRPALSCPRAYHAQVSLSFLLVPGALPDLDHRADYSHGPAASLVACGRDGRRRDARLFSPDPPHAPGRTRASNL